MPTKWGIGMQKVRVMPRQKPMMGHRDAKCAVDAPAKANDGA